MASTNVPTKTWCGSSFADMCKGKGPWSFSVSTIAPSRYHFVLYELPVNLQNPPKPHRSSKFSLWDSDHVRMPYSEENLFPVNENGVDVIKERWALIKEALSNSILSSHEFESALKKYHIALPKFEMLHYFFNEVLGQEESKHFFTNILPKIIKLALRLPELIPNGIPLLQQNHNRSLSLSQLQISSLLSNAFLCTFPWKKAVASSYPGVNFITLYSSYERPKRRQCLCEKLKCILNYFHRVTQQEPVGVVTFERKFIPRSSMPKWNTIDKNFGNRKVHVSSTGTIEDASGFLQVDFANKNIGGGVLRYGCVQEEIRFVICPELIISRLFVEQLGAGEAVVITGIERFNNYVGYGDTFQFAGNHEDTTPHDLFGRRRTSICVIDAIKFNKPRDQFQGSLILREVNKAFVGFSSREKDNLAPVATGNWGCGAFNGSKQLKTLIQLIACTVAGRDLVYYSFGDEDLMQNFYEMYLFLANNQVNVKQLWEFLGQFSRSSLIEQRFYSFIKQAYFDSKKQPSISRFFSKGNTLSKQKSDDSGGATSSNTASLSPSSSSIIKETKSESNPKKNRSKKSNEEIPSSSSSSSEDIIQSSQPEMRTFTRATNIKTKKSAEDIKEKLPDIDISAIFDMLDGNANRPEPSWKRKENERTSLSQENVDEVMEVDETEMNYKTPKKKITDYFSKIGK